MADFPNTQEAGVILADDLARDRARQFVELLDDTTQANYNYRQSLQRMLDDGKNRLIVNLDDIRDYNRALADGLLLQPTSFLPAFDAALLQLVQALHDPLKHHIAGIDYHIGLRGSFGQNHTNPRLLRSNQIGKMISLEGIVTRCSLVRPKMLKSIHYAAATQKFHSRTYHDASMIAPSSSLTGSTTVVPKDDGEGNPLSMEYGLSTFRDHQSISIQELPERSPAGQLPRGVEVILADDLVDSCKPGDRIQLVGVYKSSGGGGSVRGFVTQIIANNVILLSSKQGGGIAQTPLTDTDIRNINKLAKRRNVFDLLSQSLAPSIYGSEYIKQATLLLLLGGEEKNLKNGTHIRGDINVLMVGDPSTAKSQMLRFVLNIAPLAIATTGRGSSGVGLTAAVTQDKDTGERRLEAGACVLAGWSQNFAAESILTRLDRGVVCVDEFDKMSEIDRVAIHEVMEQQTVTIAKAGIHTTLNARCSVFAAANPVYGQYDPTKDPARNIALPDSLLSRFDLLFLVLDESSEQRDRQISEHVLKMHRYLQPGVQEGTPAIDVLNQSLDVGGEEAESRTTETPVFQRYDPLLHGGVTTTSGRGANKRKEVLNIAFVRKYLQYAKSRCHPVLTQGASDWIVGVYSALRNDDLAGNQRRTSPLTARTLETLIRLSTAHAKARLSSRVEERDAMAAEEILRYALFKEVLKAQRKKKRRLNNGQVVEVASDEEEEEEEFEDVVEDLEGVTISQQDKAREKEREIEGSAGPSQPRRERDQDDVDMEGAEALALAEEEEEVSGEIASERLDLFRSRLDHVFDTQLGAEGMLELSELLPLINEGMETQDLFGSREARLAVERMNSRNELMFSDNVVYKV